MDIYLTAKYAVHDYFGIYIDSKDKTSVNISFMREGWLERMPIEFRDVFEVRAHMFLRYIQSETRLKSEVDEFLYQVNDHRTLMKMETVIRNLLYEYEAENQVSLSDVLISMLSGKIEI